jgi:hypothetical protein
MAPQNARFFISLDPFLFRCGQEQFAGVTFAVCSVDGAPGQENLAVLHDIRVLPTCILFHGTSEVARVAGCTHKRPAKAVYDMLSKELLSVQAH